MNIVNILEEIEKVDGEIYERLNPRRSAMKDFYNMGKKVALAAMPLALGSMFTKAYGQSTPATVTDVLNYALTLEYLEFHFYNHGVEAAPGLIPAGLPLGAIKTIRDHEKAHVALLRGALGGAAIPAKAYTDFDFTAGGTFADVYTNYDTFLAVAQAFEDTGVRAYKGRATELMSSPGVLTVALQIHSVEARHAAHIRTMRAARGAMIKPWISLGAGGVANDTGIAAVNPVYAGEDTEKQATILITGIATGVTKAAAVESFDEPLTKEAVLAIAGLFIK
ncbi:ferritin-like domain-containing protein [Pedobacter foliorum]|uniref:ferritin-like domain-containing protein n=1 Tax=Pedobacter foliorum TaxID=2739058 RepID=UPI00156455F0|nr:ferritin-like domain-containing protein [Pedobacter foliorum]NRF41308.1 ferritin-like domain-containing protein [Pedobacter foliorum]